ncbi:uncharacterized protein LOC124487591 [Hypomesus transpacificus]|uniref:uncharacterized protein LOC124487591 n=1 Tax=Hypomesus transpacificus TaxID=137520 RepID=UPI001F087434|nr:uncharacterized protein LOC124487591 [Hypomesus transpacificus]
MYQFAYMEKPTVVRFLDSDLPPGPTYGPEMLLLPLSSISTSAPTRQESTSMSPCVPCQRGPSRAAGPPWGSRSLAGLQLPLPGRSPLPWDQRPGCPPVRRLKRPGCDPHLEARGEEVSPTPGREADQQAHLGTTPPPRAPTHSAWIGFPCLVSPSATPKGQIPSPSVSGLQTEKSGAYGTPARASTWRECVRLACRATHLQARGESERRCLAGG